MAGSRLAALIMAGGRSERMRAGGTRQHKGLRTVLGVPLIERNLRALLCFGFERLFVAINAQEQELGDWIAGRGRALAETERATLETLVEAIRRTLHERMAERVIETATAILPPE